jgi:hypothetical protein
VFPTAVFLLAPDVTWVMVVVIHAAVAMAKSVTIITNVLRVVPAPMFVVMRNAAKSVASLVVAMTAFAVRASFVSLVFVSMMAFANRVAIIMRVT